MLRMRPQVVVSVLLTLAGGAAALPIVREQLLPCRDPLAYRVTQADTRFAMSQQEIVAAAERAERLWEDATGYDLFVRVDEGGMPVHFVYDERQRIGDTLRQLERKIDGRSKTYETFRDTYDRQYAAYERESQSFALQLGAYNDRRAAYDAAVAAANDAGGATPDEADRLRSLRVALLDEADRLQRKQAYVNNLVHEVNALAQRLNELAPEINGEVDAFNTVGAQRGEEYEAGQYTRDVRGERVEIFVIDDFDQLTRLLAHEFGHALGMEHVDERTALMHALSLAEDLRITPADLTEFTAACRLSVAGS